MPTEIIEAEDFDILNHSSRVIPDWIKGRPPYGASVNPTSLTFSGVITGDTLTKNLRVSNAGFYTLTLGTVVIDGAAYTKEGDVPSSLAPGAYFDLAITYAPTEDGQSNGTLTINLGNSLDPIDVPLIGSAGWNYNAQIDEMISGLWGFIQRAVRPALTGDGPVASLSGSSLVFPGSTEVDQHSSIMTITLTNSGNQNLVVDSITASGDFEVIE